MNWNVNTKTTTHEGTMSCPTCSATMTAFGCRVTDRNFFVCPRCGTVKTCDGGVTAPDLVRRCREFEQQYLLAGDVSDITALLRRLGIAEAINTPDARPE